LHIGGARTALFNYLFARNQGGVFLLRIEDTDRDRSTEESIQAILDSLRWLELDWDEGPYFQSERGGIYREHAERLLSSGAAYRCYCTVEEIEQKRQLALTEGRKPVYDRTCRRSGRAPKEGPFVIRFATPEVGETSFADLIRGRIVVQNSELDDLIIVRTDESFTFNFCNVVDDALMGITHIIRGEDHLLNTARQIHIYGALGYPLPDFAHVPLILGLDRARLSKRHGATSVIAYHEEGYLPHALVNYLVRLGWSHGDQEIFARQELIEKFSLSRVGSAAGAFNPEKLEWVNAQHMKMLTPAQLAAAVKPFVAARGWRVPGDDHWLAKMVATLQERAKTLVELVDQARFYLCDDIEIDPQARAKHLAKANPQALRELRDELAQLGDWAALSVQGVFESVMARHQLGLGKIAQPVRVALTGGTVSPGIFEVIEVLGRERTLERLDRAMPIVDLGVRAAE
jgi:glutamyl-tRNA synthetase